MQTLGWYYRRLRAMSAGEVAWRVQASLCDRLDRLLVGRRQQPRPPAEILEGDGNTPGFRFCTLGVGEWERANALDDVRREWRHALLEKAEKIAQHRLSFFDLQDQYLGDPIVWNRDHKRGQDTPLVFSSALDYRDVQAAGDCKFVWEPNRHHQLVVLGRAYRASGEIRFARAVAEQLDSWLQQNPYGLGMNWRSGLELAIRLINWVWALDLIEEAHVINAELRARIVDSVARHVWEIDRKYSRGSSVNNHLIGEAAGVFVAASYFPNLKHAATWRQRSWAILEREILNQTFADGGTQEQAVGYHLFVLQFFVVAGLVARATGREASPSYWSRLEKMFEFLAILGEGGEQVPRFGDGDDGYVLDVGRHPRSIREWLAVGAALFDRSDFKAVAGGLSETVEWLLGEPGCRSFLSLSPAPNAALVSRALEDSGYYLLQCGHAGSSDRISVVFDCGPLGMGALAGHGHADTLSFTLRAFGVDVLVDPGTYDYFSYPSWRRYFRGTRAHNTLVVDDCDQSEMLGLFLWGRKARARCLQWKPSAVVGEHDGYTCLQDPVVHRRTLELDGRERVLVVRDDIQARGKHDLAMYLHLAAHCEVVPAGANRFRVAAGPGTVEIELDQHLAVSLLHGSDDPIGGWVSPGYHQKEAATCLIGRCRCEGNMSLTCRFRIGEGTDSPLRALSLERPW